MKNSLQKGLNLDQPSYVWRYFDEVGIFRDRVRVIYRLAASHNAVSVMSELDRSFDLFIDTALRGEALLRGVQRVHLPVLQYLVESFGLLPAFQDPALVLASRVANARVMSYLLSKRSPDRDLQSLCPRLQEVCGVTSLFQELPTLVSADEVVQYINSFISAGQCESSSFVCVLEVLMTSTLDDHLRQAAIRHIGETHFLHATYDAFHVGDDEIRKYGTSEQRYVGLQSRTACRHLRHEMFQHVSDVIAGLRLAARVDRRFDIIWKMLHDFPETSGRTPLQSIFRRLLPTPRQLSDSRQTQRIVRQLGEELILRETEDKLAIVCGEDIHDDRGSCRLVTKSPLFKEVQHSVAVDTRVVLLGTLVKGRQAVFVSCDGVTATMLVPETESEALAKVVSQLLEASTAFDGFLASMADRDY